MFEARLNQGSLLKKLVEALKELVSEANFEVSSKGISLQAMDSSHVCLVAMELSADNFEPYRCDRPLSMGVNIPNLLKILKCAGNEDVITLRADDNGDLLTLIFESAKRDRVSDFDLKLLSIDAQTLAIPEQDCMAEVLFPASEYQRICRDLSSIGDTVSVNAVKDAIKFTTHGDVGSGNVLLRHSTQDDSSDDVTIQVDEPVSLTFALRYLNNFAKATPLASKVRLRLTRDLPIVVAYELGDDKGSIRYFLAPKIDDDEAVGDEEECNS